MHKKLSNNKYKQFFNTQELASHTNQNVITVCEIMMLHSCDNVDQTLTNRLSIKTCHSLDSNLQPCE